MLFVKLTPKKIMDSIRARSLLKNNYCYQPSDNIAIIIKESASELGISLNNSDYLTSKLDDIDKKEKLLIKLGNDTKHFVPNSQLHKISVLGDVLEFYSKPVNNITKYSEMARDEDLPKNIAVMENPVRFNPNDTESPHGGVTAFPGEGGQIYGLRNKRIYRQFKPRKEWYEYEEQSFDYDDPSKGLTWDPEIAKKMDRYPDRKFLVNRVQKI